VELYRLAKKKYSHSLSGVGAAIRGARWNSRGTEIVYTATNRSLAMAEVAVHFSLGNIPEGYQMLTIYLPDEIPVYQLSDTELPSDWQSFPQLRSTQFIGDEFVRAGTYLAMKVPSAVTKGDFNILLNSHHPSFADVRILNVEPFVFDRRLF